MIVIFSHAHPSISKGGAEVSAYTLFKGLRQLGHAATFVAMCPEEQLARVRFDTPHEMVLPFRAAAYDHFFHFADPALFRAALEAVTPLQPSALVFHHFLFLGINTLRQLADHFNVPSVLVLHEFLAICHHHGQMVTRPAKKLCDRSSPTRCGNCFPEHAPEELHIRKQFFLQTMLSLHKLVSPSHFLAERFVAWGLPAQQVAVIENGLAGYEPATEPAAEPSKPLSGSSSRRALSLRLSSSSARAGSRTSEKTVFGYFGQINPFKGIDQILDAVDLLKKNSEISDRIQVRIHGNVVGVTDAFKARFEAAALPGGLVDYTGPYNNADVHTLMQACDYILMASMWWENSPVVIQEAYAAERPVIAPGFGGMAEKVIDKITGRHFNPNDPADLARLMLECSQSKSAGDIQYEIPKPLTAKDMARHYIEMLK